MVIARREGRRRSRRALAAVAVLAATAALAAPATAAPFAPAVLYPAGDGLRAPVAGDFDGDGDVDGTDLFEFVQNLFVPLP